MLFTLKFQGQFFSCSVSVAIGPFFFGQELGSTFPAQKVSFFLCSEQNLLFIERPQRGER